ncbi:LacI family DNA-binding transcriptional regulator [Planctomonas psychrotolerans]|uniref:LacI family DNA-binding transcriptional regulator n=1 Tax=Planctomonas psychrotolerans TaxID=2528712 RepID=UPI00123AF437|nr:LacI family DNA-binding transcriptional regulator [Planctomonas psychrotolerans]
MTTARKAPITLHDVAREAGVSLATASRSLNGSARRVNEDYRKRVLAAAAKLNYTPNTSAQAVAKGTTNTVALLVADIADPYFSSIAAGVIRSAEDAGLIVTMAATERSPERELTLVRALRGQRPRVLILAASRVAEEASQDALIAELAAFEAMGGRVVFISRNELDFDSVLVDNYGGARQLAEELIGLGYRRFAALAGDLSLLTAQDRIAGFTDGLAAHGIELPPDRLVRTGFTRDGGHAGMLELAGRGLDDVELVFTVNDVMAVGAMSALRESGREPGVDVGIAGFDDIQTARDVTPALTTVRIPLEEVGRRAIARALLPSPESGEPATPTATEVMLRASTPGPRPGG